MKAPSALPPPPPNFLRKKERILEALAVPDAEYSDASPKGSVDAGIRDLIGEINALDGFVTTSSCAGRVSVFVEGRKVADAEKSELEEDAARPATLAAVGGKGGGGTWLFVSHDPVVGDASEDVKSLLGLCGSVGYDDEGSRGDSVKAVKDTRLIHFKFEPMVSRPFPSQSIVGARPTSTPLRLQAGFRESGAINLTSTTAEAITPIVAIRSMGLSFESLVGIRENDSTKCTVSDNYLHSLLRIANERFEENRKRIERFRTTILDASYPPKKRDGTEWEDPQARRERKRAEGLRRKAELQGHPQKGGDTGADDVDLDISMNTHFT
ncbi:hypothetical protein EKO27_g3085 [Xylaria grammica]|uniref:tRNA(Phe) 7-[(3-amino-3-carboxypropyl)-4-demethylwyosine(37)-N(4)]-methyltransferase n=1 Tax=Xylaria grammica TaxID=363999 RepID=A0A439DCB3_9PEZI|nr:hypothetical protein EKO27_g3085 [Xylaria grammica]